MTRRVVIVAVWLAAGGTLLAAFSWLFLITPESNAWMLTASAVLAVAIVLTLAVVVNAAVLLALGRTLRNSVAEGARRAGWFLVAAAPLVALIALVNAADAWITRHSGEISAWFIARFGLADADPLFALQRYSSIWVRWVLLPVLALAGLASRLYRGPGVRRPWLRAASNWRTLLVATLSFLMLIALPWRAAFWQMTGLPHNWVEPTVAVLRLGGLATLIALGFAIMVVSTARQTVRVDPGEPDAISDGVNTSIPGHSSA